MIALIKKMKYIVDHNQSLVAAGPSNTCVDEDLIR